MKAPEFLFKIIDCFPRILKFTAFSLYLVSIVKWRSKSSLKKAIFSLNDRTTHDIYLMLENVVEYCMATAIYIPFYSKSFLKFIWTRVHIYQECSLRILLKTDFGGLLFHCIHRRLIKKFVGWFFISLCRNFL